MEMKAILVDSNAEIKWTLWNFLCVHQIFHLEADMETTEEAAAYIQSHPVDVVFINHQPNHPHTTSAGEYLAALLAQSQPDVQVVVYSTREDDAYWAYRSQCAGFLLIPFDPLSLQMLVKRLTYIYDLQQVKREAMNRSIMIKTHSGYQLTKVQEILFVERSNRRNRIVTESGREIVLLGYTMNELEKMLDGSGFYRCYQSFIVNLSKVSFIRVDNDSKSYAIQFDGYDGEILLSRDKYSEILLLLKERYARINI